MRSSDEIPLIQQVAAGDEAAFERLYALHSVAVYNYLLRLVARAEIAEELLQETFVVVWQQAALFEGRASVKTWIFRIAHNKAVSWLRAHRETLPLMAVEEYLSASNPAMDAFDNREVLQRALRQLSPAHRAVIELAFGQGLTYREIALVLGCPVGTVKSRMKYAIKHLEGLIQREE